MEVAVQGKELQQIPNYRLSPYLIPQHSRQQVHHNVMFIGELQTKPLNGSDHNNLKLVRNFRHEALNLLHQPINTAFIPSLQEGCDSKSSNAPVRVGDEMFQV